MQALSALSPGSAREGSKVAAMAKRSTFFVRGAVQALALLVLVVAGAAWPERSIAAPDNLQASANLDAHSRQLGAPNLEALDRPAAGRCGPTRNAPTPRAEPRRQTGTTAVDESAAADADVVPAFACNLDGEPGPRLGPWQVDRRSAVASPAPFQSRAPPSRPLLTVCAGRPRIGFF